MLISVFRVVGFWFQGFRVLVSGFRVLGFGFQVFRVLGFWFQDLGFRDWEFRVLLRLSYGELWSSSARRVYGNWFVLSWCYHLGFIGFRI